MFTAREPSLIAGRVTDQHYGGKHALNWESLRNGHGPTDSKLTASSDASNAHSQMGGPTPAAANQKASAVKYSTNSDKTAVITDLIPIAETNHQ